MRIRRDRSQFTFRKRRRSGGLLPWAVVLGLLATVVGLSWGRIGQLLNPTSQTANADLQTIEAAFLRGDLNTVIEQMRRTLEQEPENTEILLWLVRALLYRSYNDYNYAADRQSALTYAEAAYHRKPKDAQVLTIYALALQANNAPLEAAEIAQQALRIQSDNALARTALALAYAAAGSHELANREMLHAEQLSRQADIATRIDILRALAITYSDLGRYEEALKTVDSAIALNNRLLPLHFERALYAMQMGNADVATVAYFQVLAYNPENVKARLRLCELSTLLREHEAAIDYCSEVVSRAPDWAEGWYRLGREYFLQGNYRMAQQSLNRCTTLQVAQDVPIPERRFECWYLQGQAAEILGDCPSLLATYNEFRAMAAVAALEQTWTYPPEGPPSCVTPTANK